MSKIKALAIEAQNASIEIASKIAEAVDLIRSFQSKYGSLVQSDDPAFSQLEKTFDRRLNIDAGIVRFVEIGPEQLLVQLR